MITVALTSNDTCKTSSCMTTKDFLTMLKEHGLNTIPGTAAEILDVDIRKQLTKDKLTAAQWCEIVITAHQLGIRSSSTMMYGHIDSPAHWAKHIGILRDIQKQTGGFTEFVPLGFIHQNAPLYLEGKARPGPTPDEHLKVHAVARLMLAGFIDNIQVSWVKLGWSLAREVLRAGANDLGGTLMNEEISYAAGARHGTKATPASLTSLIKELDRTPTERTTTYQRLVMAK